MGSGLANEQVCPEDGSGLANEQTCRYCFHLSINIVRTQDLTPDPLRGASKTALGVTDAPYRPQAERRLVARDRIGSDRDCWFVTSHPEHGPYAVPLSFVIAADRMFLFTQPHRPTVRNVQVESRVELVFGGHGEAISASGECHVLALAEVERQIVERYITRAGWDPAEPGSPFVALGVTLTSVSCSRSPAEHHDHEIWQSGMPPLW